MMQYNVFQRIIVDFDSSDGGFDRSVTLVVYPPHVSVDSVLTANIQAGVELFDSGFSFSRGDAHAHTTHRDDSGMHEEVMNYLFSVPAHTSYGWIKHKYGTMGYSVNGVSVEMGRLT